MSSSTMGCVLFGAFALLAACVCIIIGAAVGMFIALIILGASVGLIAVLFIVLAIVVTVRDRHA